MMMIEMHLRGYDCLLSLGPEVATIASLSSSSSSYNGLSHSS